MASPVSRLIGEALTADDPAIAQIDRQGADPRCPRYPFVNLCRVIFRDGDWYVMPVVVGYFLPVELAARLSAAFF